MKQITKLFAIVLTMLFATTTYAQSVTTNIRVAKDVNGELPYLMEYDINISKEKQKISFDCLNCPLDFYLSLEAHWETVIREDNKIEYTYTKDGDRIIVLSVNGELNTIGFEQLNGVTLYYVKNQNLTKNETKI